MGRAVYINNIMGEYATDSTEEEGSVEQPLPAQHFRVRTTHSKGTIYIGMPKDSVIMVLGQPDQFNVGDNYDQITYYRDAYGASRINISFDGGRIESVNQY